MLVGLGVLDGLGTLVGAGVEVSVGAVSCSRLGDEAGFGVESMLTVVWVGGTAVDVGMGVGVGGGGMTVFGSRELAHIAAIAMIPTTATSPINAGTMRMIRDRYPPAFRLEFDSMLLDVML